MKILLENWRQYLKEDKQVISTKKEIISYIKNNPDQSINVDYKKGSMKGFAGADEIIPFDYGEWPDLTNPADNMGWDLIIVPSASEGSKDLTPIGHVDYDPELKPNKVGNDKIIVAPGSNYSQEDKKIIDDFFNKLQYFKEVVWFKKEDKKDGDD